MSINQNDSIDLTQQQHIHVKQRHEIAEWFGFETRNKYDIQDQMGRTLAYAAEQGHGFLGQMVRQFVGHWRTFDILFFTPDRRQILRAHHPFRWFFQRLEIYDGDRYIGALQQRFSILIKRFDVEGPQGQILMTVASPFWRLWTFPFEKQGRQVAIIAKRWSGALTELFTDKDNFGIEYSDPSLSNQERILLMASSLFIDLQYFERKANNNSAF